MLSIFGPKICAHEVKKHKDTEDIELKLRTRISSLHNIYCVIQWDDHEA